ncbi:Flagellar hook-associated protein 3 [Ruminococcaceae bacterium BL-6]|nr:Flagellar hook-associated protein 3 [Ruminococcaceae bacterium BL-6]
MRITLGMINRQYNKNLNAALNQLNSGYLKTTTLRKFEKTSDDPFSASKAYQLRREYEENQTYLDTLDSVDSQFMTSESAMRSIYSVISSADSSDVLQGITGTMNQDDRKIIADKLRQMQKAIVAPANTKFGDKYVFGGSEMDEAPFSVDGDGNLFYRGINVDTGELENGTAANFNGTLIEFGDGFDTTDAAANYKDYVLKITDAGEGNSSWVDPPTSNLITLHIDLSKVHTNQDLLNELRSMGTKFTGLDFSKVRIVGDMNRTVTDGMESSAIYDSVSMDTMGKLANEEMLANLGLGLQLDEDGKIDSQSAFNTSIPGISFLGYGTSNVDGTEMPDNLYSLLGKIADQLESDDFSMDGIQPYLDHFSDQENKLLSEITKMGAKSNFLSTLKSNLDPMGDKILERDQNVENVEPEDAITDFYMQQYAYQAALSIGTKIISKTLLDFMY